MIALVIAATRWFPRGHLARLGAVLAVVFTITEALVGAGLVRFGLVAKDDSIARAVVMAIHLVNTSLLTGALTLTVWSAGRREPPGETSTRVGLWLAGAIGGLLLVGVSGAVTALGDTLYPVGGANEGAGAHFLQRLRAFHPVIAVSPRQVAEMLLAGDADIGVATEALAGYGQLVTLPCYRWSHSIVVPPGHSLLSLGRPVTLLDLVAHPVITYEVGYTGRSHIDDAFAAAGLRPDVVLTAMDADVIKTYVELEMGVGIVASIAFDEDRDKHLHAIDPGHLFHINTTRLGLRRNHWLPGFACGFIETFVPTLTREAVMAVQEAN